MFEQKKPDQKMNEALRRTVRHVVETMCFAEVAPTDETWQKAETIVTAVNFYGSRSGRLELEVSSSAAWSLRDAFLGEPQPGLDKGSADQVIGELGTMICGRFLSAVDPLSELTLATPRKSAVAPGKAPQQLRQAFSVDSGHLTASIEFDDEN